MFFSIRDCLPTSLSLSRLLYPCAGFSEGEIAPGRGDGREGEPGCDERGLGGFRIGSLGWWVKRMGFARMGWGVARRWGLY